MKFNNLKVPQVFFISLKRPKIERLSDSGDEIYNVASNAVC
jgi:hypothetical protein